jgi:hypothetical protein
MWKKRRLFTPWILWFAGSTILKINSILKGKPYAGCSSFYTDGFLSKTIIHFEMNLQRSGVGQDRNKMSTYPPWKMWFAASIPFKNYVSGQGKQCARCSCSNIDSLLCRVTCVSLNWMNTANWTKWVFLHLVNRGLQALFHCKCHRFLTGKQWDGCCSSNVDNFPWREKCADSPQLNRPMWKKQKPYASWKTQVAESISFKY